MQQPTWVFIHGWGSSNDTWAELQPLLPGPSICLALPGFGGETQDSLESLLSQWLNALPATCILVGWSLGGMLATRLAYLAPHKVKGLVTIACNPCFVEQPGWSCAMSRATFDDFCQQFVAHPQKTWQRFCALQAQGDDQRRRVTDILKSQSGPSETAQKQWLTALRWLDQLDNRAILSHIACPQLHLLGERDALVPATLSDCIVSQVLAGLGHAPHLSQPNLVAQHITLWCDDNTPRSIDKQRIAASFGAAAKQYDSAAHVQKRVAQDLLAFAGELNANNSALDLGCGTGFVAEQLDQTGIEVFTADLALEMVNRCRQKLPHIKGCVADAENLPWRSGSFDYIVSSLALQWCGSLNRVAQEAERILRSEGLFLFSTLGPDTLWELKRAWSEVDEYVHVNRFLSAEAIQQQLGQEGLDLVQLKRYPLTVHYTEVITLLRELKAIGAHNMNPGRNPGLTLRSRVQRLEQAYRQWQSDEGLFPATYDVILVLAQKGKSP